MPTHDRLRLKDFQRLQHFGGEAIEPNKQQSIDVAEGHSRFRSYFQSLTEAVFNSFITACPHDLRSLSHIRAKLLCCWNFLLELLRN